MSRIRAGNWGILVASVIRRAPEKLHEPLTQILLSMDCLPYDELHHLRRLIEVNIPRGKEKYIQRCENSARKLLEKHPNTNLDCVAIINALEGVVRCILTSEEIKNERKEAREYEKQNNKSKNNREVIH